MDALFRWLIALLAATLLLLWLLLFADVRTALGRCIQAYFRRLHAFARGIRTQVRRTVLAGLRAARNRSTGISARLRRHWLLLAMLMLILLAPAALVLGMHRHVMLQGYGAERPADPATAALLAGLLRGEQLAPPTPLPPTVFVTPDVERVLPHLGSADRKWPRLDPDFRQRLLAVFRIMEARYGYRMALLEGYRSPERQAALAAEGASVTRAGPGQSYHQYGLAADCAFYRDGKLVVSGAGAWATRGYELYGQVAQAAGLVWGGSWKMHDLGHVELHVAGAGPRAYVAPAAPAAE